MLNSGFLYKLFNLASCVPFCVFALNPGSYGEKWAEIHYSNKPSSEKIALFDGWIESSAPETREEETWILMGRISRTNLIGASSKFELSYLIPELHSFSREPITELDFMLTAVIGGLYATTPGWPFGYGSSDLARQHLNKAAAMEFQPDVAFYLAQGFFSLNDYNRAQFFLSTAQTGFRNLDSVYDQGKRFDIAQLQQKIFTKRGL